jgi:hypothetical protein
MLIAGKKCVVSKKKKKGLLPAPHYPIPFYSRSQKKAPPVKKSPILKYFFTGIT